MGATNVLLQMPAIPPERKLLRNFLFFLSVSREAVWLGCYRLLDLTYFIPN